MELFRKKKDAGNRKKCGVGTRKGSWGEGEGNQAGRRL